MTAGWRKHFLFSCQGKCGSGCALTGKRLQVRHGRKKKYSPFLSGPAAAEKRIFWTVCLSGIMLLNGWVW